MSRPRTLQPKYRHHKATGRAYVVLDGKSVYLGKHKSTESWKRYHAALAEWAARGYSGSLAAGMAPPVVLEATHMSTLEFVSLADLQDHAFKPAKG